MKRKILNLSLLFSILFLPWWCALIVGIVSVFFVDRMYELVVWGVLFDVIFGNHLFGSPTSGLIIGVILCILSFFVSKRFLMRI